MLNVIKLILIPILICVTVGLGLVLHNFMDNDFNFNPSSLFRNESTTLVAEKNFDILNDISINSKTANIYIKNSEENNYKVEIYSDVENEYNINNANNNLSITVEEKNKISFLNKTTKIVIFLPYDYNKNITIDNKVGDIDMESFEQANINIITTTGDVDINNANNVTYNNTTGDLDINNVNRLKVESKTGDIKVNNINEYLDIKTTTGDIKIENLNIKENSNIDSNTGDIKINNINDIYVEQESKIGDVNINNTNRFSEITLHIKSVVGDIKVG